jgi:hypothetical protein
MTVADWALVISICSAAISIAGFVWNNEPLWIAAGTER